MHRFLSLLVLMLIGVSPTQTPKAPFKLAVVPTFSGAAGGTIEMARDKARDFYVVLTNISGDSQPVWEVWNSWGYRAISFEITTADGKKFIVSRVQGHFTKNAPTTFLIAPTEHQVFAIKLDKWWESHPAPPKTDSLHVSLKAVYEVSSTPEAAQQNVWTGRLESRTYDLALRQW